MTQISPIAYNLAIIATHQYDIDINSRGIKNFPVVRNLCYTKD